MNKITLIKLLEPHKEFLTTVAKWDEYAKKHKLPTSHVLIYEFRTWTNVKKALHISARYKRYTKEELLKIAIKHKDYFKRKRIWEEYSKEHGLPHANTYIQAFGTWENVKTQIGLVNIKRKDDIISKEMIEKVLREHGKNFINRTQWDEYAKEHKLPTYKTVRKHFTHDDILDFAGRGKNQLLNIALHHSEFFLNNSMTKWDKYAAEKNLPSSNKYHKAFGSWKNAKMEIAKRILEI